MCSRGVRSNSVLVWFEWAIVGNNKMSSKDVCSNFRFYFSLNGYIKKMDKKYFHRKILNFWTLFIWKEDFSQEVCSKFGSNGASIEKTRAVRPNSHSISVWMELHRVSFEWVMISSNCGLFHEFSRHFVRGHSNVAFGCSNEGALKWL